MHYRKVIAVLAAGLSCSAGLLAATTQTTTQKKKSAHPKTRVAARRTPSKAGTVRTVHKAPARSTRPARSTWHAGQTAPTPDRYKEIQGALAQKGYLHGEATGVWNQDSADALRRFQQDQNLQVSGKLDSLSIIALGLGPKH